MIARCNCGSLKTVSPYMNAMQVPWLCNECSRNIERREHFENKEQERLEALHNR